MTSHDAQRRRRGALSLISAVALAAVVACSPAAPAELPHSTPPARASQPVRPPPPPQGVDEPPGVAEAPAPEPPAAAPATESFDPTLPTRVPVSGDRAAQVAHGAIGNPRALVYLHGVCGDIHKFRAWTEVAVHFGTVVAVPGDDACDEPGRFKWGSDLQRTDRRIAAALRAVSATRTAPLDIDSVTLVGYSQGSARAEGLVRRFPARYRRAVLIAGPHEHDPSSFRESLGVALVAGEKDFKAHLVDSAAKARKAGRRAHYFELPGARHGDYGPEAGRVMREVLAWLFAEDVSPAKVAP